MEFPELRNSYPGPASLSKSLLLLIIFLAIALAGCSRLPQLNQHFQAKGEEVSVETDSGKLTPGQCRLILENLEKNITASDIQGKHVQCVEMLARSPVKEGNKVSLLINRPTTYVAMARAIQEARDNINFETYGFQDSTIGRRFGLLLEKKRAEGAGVNVIYDSAGNWRTSPDFFREMGDSGIQLLEYNPINPLKTRRGWSPFYRDHRKVLVVDGSIGFTGGGKHCRTTAGR